MITPPFPLAGELAALITAACWAATSLVFEAAGRRVGSMPVSFLRLVIGFVLLVPTAWVLRGEPFPTDATPQAWLWLSLSGVVGLSLGDLCLFRAFVVLGPRLSTLMMSLVPAITSVIGWLWLGEVLAPRDLMGMSLTMGGIALAVLERSPRGVAPAAERPLQGFFLALGGAFGQAIGLVLSKLGMGAYDALAANEIRVLAGILGYALLLSALGAWGRARVALFDRRALALSGVGAFFGPLLGVSLSLVAVQYTQTGVAASIMGTTPILILPAVVLFRRETVGARGALGAFLTVGGLVLLFR